MSMESKNKKGEAIVKRDTTENWKKAKNYAPPIGIIIIMDNDDGTFQLKFGDGKTNVNDLPDLLKNNNQPEVDEASGTIRF